MTETFAQTQSDASPNRGGRNLEGWQGTRWFYRILPLLVFTALVLVGAYWYFPSAAAQNSYMMAIVFSAVLCVFLALLPAMICVVQNITKRRQEARLASLEKFPVSKTIHYQVAVSAIQAMRVNGVDSDYGAPLFVYFFVLFAGFAAIFVGYSFTGLFSRPTVLLGGLKSIADTDYATYQIQTFVVVSMAFLASYVYSLGRLLDRINNSDLYPISLYYYATRIVIACVVAAVLRHSAEIFSVGSPILLLIGFGIGFAPDQFVLALTRRAFQALKIWGSRDDPPANSRPRSLPLLMIDDLTREKIDRLNELGVDSVQVLARQNPFLLLPRLPYDLGLIIDWIGQAQLYVLVREQYLQTLRGMLIRDVFDLYIRLMDDKARPEVAKALDLSDSTAAALTRQLDQDQSFTRLQEVRGAMLQCSRMMSR